MVLEATSGSQDLSSGDAEELFTSKTALELYNTKIFLNTLADDDEIVIRIFNNDIADSNTEKAIDIQTLVGRDVNGIPCVNIPWLPDNSYLVTVQQTVANATFKTITWVRHDQ